MHTEALLMSESQHSGAEDQLISVFGLFSPVSFCPHEMASRSPHLLLARHFEELPEGSPSKWGLLPAVPRPPASPDERVSHVSWTGLQTDGNTGG